MQTKSSGFTLLEVSIWVVIIGVVIGMGVKLMFQKKPLDNISYLISELNNISLAASRHALVTNKVVQLKITLGPEGSIITKLSELQEPVVPTKLLSSKENNTSATVSPNFAEITNFFMPTSLKLDTKLQLQKIAHDVTNGQATVSGQSKVSAVTLSQGKKAEQELITYYLPSGTCEGLQMNILRKDVANQVSLKVSLNQLLCRFEILDPESLEKRK